MAETVTMRTSKIELKLMAAELLFDGLKTHIDLKRNPPCPLKNTDIDRLIHRATGYCVSARNIMRNDMGHKQPTLTTRGGPADRHGLWKCTPKKSLTFICPFCHPKSKTTL